jgi:hypothetical protein
MKNDKPKVLSKTVKRKLSLKEHKNRDRTTTLLKRQGKSNRRKKEAPCTTCIFGCCFSLPGLTSWFTQSTKNG